MKDVTVYLNDFNSVENFANILSEFESDFDVLSGRYIVNGKSIIGILSLGFESPFTLRILEDRDVEPVLEAIKDYLVER